MEDFIHMQPEELVEYKDTQTTPLSVAVNNTAASTSKPFITANTVECTLEEVRRDHIIPVFLKDNEPVISHTDFIEVTQAAAKEVFGRETMLPPAVRLSHPIKGRVPEAKHKPAAELFEWEKTLYYERMAFVIEIPSIYDTLGSDTLSLTLGGVKAYNLDNLNAKKGTEEHFKLFIGFQNRVCTNLCVWSDGYAGDVRVKSIHQLKQAVLNLIMSYSATLQLEKLQRLNQYHLTEQQFAQLIGRCRMYGFLPAGLKKEIPPMLLTDTQLGMVVRDYYKDASFARDVNGHINLWKLYNLFTGAGKSTYIDAFLERNVGAGQFTEEVRLGLEGKTTSWYLS
jgi:hypothetical protein